MNGSQIEHSTRPTAELTRILDAVYDETVRQDVEHGWQSKLDLIGSAGADPYTVYGLQDLEVRSRLLQEKHRGSFLHLVVEELSEAASEGDPEKMEAELVHLAALAIGWAQASRERRGAK